MTDLAQFQPVRARVVDFETTGLPEEADSRICEVGFVDVDLTDPEFPLLPDTAYSTLINPGVQMRPEISAVHHLVDADLAGQPSVDVGFMALGSRMTDADVYVAHNALFEQHFYGGRPQPWVCTYRCALRAWPDAPSHSNQALRYFLNLQLDRELASPPHRALPDAYVTAHILQRLLFLRPIERLIEISNEPGILPRFNYGKHKGKSYRDVAVEDASYLRWIVEKSDMGPDEKHTAKFWLGKVA